MRRFFGLILWVSLSGCSLFRRDLVEEGVYQVDASNFCGHALAVRAWESGGKLVVKGRVMNLPYSVGLPADGEVSLAASDGVEIATKRAAFRRWYKHRGRSYPFLQVEFERIPPPGSLIRVRSAGAVSECGRRK